MRHLRHAGPVHSSWGIKLFSLAITICGILIIAAVVGSYFFGNHSWDTRPAAEWEALVDPERLIEPSHGQVQIVIFSDFQCPFCATAQVDLAALRQRYPGHIAAVYRHLPLTEIHPFAFGAALAAECARDQGVFARFYDVLFQEQQNIGRTHWRDLGSAAGIPDLNEFERCRRERVHEERVRTDMRLAKQLGIMGTPTIIVEGRIINGDLRHPAVDSIIRHHLRRDGTPSPPGS